MFINYTTADELTGILEDFGDETVICWKETRFGLNVATKDYGKWWLNGASIGADTLQVVTYIIGKTESGEVRVLLNNGSPV